MMDKIIRERKTEERVRKVDKAEIVDIIHELEDDLTSAEDSVADLMELNEKLFQHHENIIAAASTFTKDHPSAFLRGGMDAMVAEANKALNHKEG